MEVVEVLIGADTVKIMAIALVVIAVAIILGIRLLGQALATFKRGNEKWEELTRNLTQTVQSQLEATKTLIEIVEVASKSYRELREMMKDNQSELDDMRARMEGVIVEAGAIDKMILTKLDAILAELKGSR